MQHQEYMQLALELAKRAATHGEVPVGAIVVLDDQVIGEGYNQPIASSDPSAHAEIIAMRAAAKKIANYRLLNSSLYVTLEPCLMCAGAMLHARIKSLIYGADDPKFGASKNIFNLETVDDRVNHRVECIGGVLAEASAELLRDFFRVRR